MDYFFSKRNTSINSTKYTHRKSSYLDCYTIKWKNGIVYKLMLSDLTEQDTNVIVNAANDELRLGGGVAGAIRNKGGYRIQQECCDKLKANGRYFKNGQVVATGIGDFKNSNLKYIFHAVGPVYYNGKRGEAEDLKKTFSNCFSLSEEMEIESVSMPPISSGIFGYPKEECCEIFYKCLENFVKEKIHSGSNVILKEIRMTIIDDLTYNVFAEIHQKLILNFKEIFGEDILEIIGDSKQTLENEDNIKKENFNLEKVESSTLQNENEEVYPIEIDEEKYNVFI